MELGDTAALKRGPRAGGERAHDELRRGDRKRSVGVATHELAETDVPGAEEDRLCKRPQITDDGRGGAGELEEAHAGDGEDGAEEDARLERARDHA